MLLSSELYEYCSKAVALISASFQGAPNLLHIHFHLTIPLNYLNSPSQKWSPSIITPSSEALVEFGDLQIHSTSPHSCRAEGFLRLPHCSFQPGPRPHSQRPQPWKSQSQGRAKQLFTGVLDIEDLPPTPLIISMVLLGGSPPGLHARSDIPALQL